MSNRKEHVMDFQLNAELGSQFNSSFKSAQKELVTMQNELQSLNRTQSDISAYQKQQNAISASQSKLQLLQKEYDNIQREIQETEGFSSSLESKLLKKQLQIEKTTSTVTTYEEKLAKLGTHSTRRAWRQSI